MKKLSFYRKLKILFLLEIILSSTTSFAMTPANEARYVALTEEIRCVVCQNQSIADSAAPLANDLRGKIYAMVENNKSDNEIKNYLVARYGEFILLKPRLTKLTLALWLFPFVSLITFICVWLKRAYQVSPHQNRIFLPAPYLDEKQ